MTRVLRPSLIKAAAMLLLPPVRAQQCWVVAEGGRLSEGCSLAVTAGLLTTRWSNKAARIFAELEPTTEVNFTFDLTPA